MVQPPLRMFQQLPQICITTFLLPFVTFGTTAEQVGECNCIVGGEYRANNLARHKYIVIEQNNNCNCIMRKYFPLQICMYAMYSTKSDFKL